MRNVLVIAYEFPPTGGGGVQRVAKFCRYLPQAGWQPTVIAAEPVHGRAVDESLAEEVAHVRVVRTPARHVASAISRAARIAGAARPATRQRVGTDTEAAAGGTDSTAPGLKVPAASSGGGGSRASKVTGWVAVPDFAAYWVGPAVEAGTRVGSEVGAKAVVASGPPFSALVAGARIAKRLGVPFVADFRDAWRDNPAASHPTSWHRERSLTLERAVLVAAAAVTCVSPPIRDEVQELGGREVTVLPNGFDAADLVPWSPDPAAQPRIAFMGWLYPAHSDPAPLLEAMAVAADRSEAARDLVFDVIGPKPAFAAEAAEKLGVADRVVFHGYRPHAEALELLSHADVGVVLVRDVPQSKGSYTGKIFEYLGMGIPILLAGPLDGVAADLVREARAGWAVAHGDVDGLADVLVRLAEDKRSGVRPAPPEASVVARFDRRSQAATLGAVLDRVIAP
jgi:glycosyltransferase involved in cell wall biosynthesis